jgi:hypothetical protein
MSVGSTRYQQPDIHAVARGRLQGLHVGGRAGVVGIGEPEPLSREGRHELIHAKQARRAGHGRDDAQSRISRRRARIASYGVVG